MSRFYDLNPLTHESSTAERWGKQVAVRFNTEELKHLDELVAAKAKIQTYPRVTRSSTVIHLVTAAHNKLLNDRRRSTDPLPSGDPDVAELPGWQQRELERKPVRQKRRRSRQTRRAPKTKAKKKSRRAKK